MKYIQQYLGMSLFLLFIAACGGGGGDIGTIGQNQATTKTTASLRISQTGSLPISTTISGAAFTLTLPANVTPEMSNGMVATTVVTNSGTFFGSSLFPQVVYTAATSGSPGTLKVILASSIPAGVTLVGEVATIILQCAEGAAPTTNSFIVSEDIVYNATLYAPIIGMNVIVADVTLQ